MLWLPSHIIPRHFAVDARCSTMRHCIASRGDTRAHSDDATGTAEDRAAAAAGDVRRRGLAVPAVDPRLASASRWLPLVPRLPFAGFCSLHSTHKVVPVPSVPGSVPLRCYWQLSLLEKQIDRCLFDVCAPSHRRANIAHAPCIC
jgi:hypothetical protein